MCLPYCLLHLKMLASFKSILIQDWTTASATSYHSRNDFIREISRCWVTLALSNNCLFYQLMWFSIYYHYGTGRSYNEVIIICSSTIRARRETMLLPSKPQMHGLRARNSPLGGSIYTIRYFFMYWLLYHPSCTSSYMISYMHILHTHSTALKMKYPARSWPVQGQTINFTEDW